LTFIKEAELLKLIIEHNSLSELERISNRKKSNLPRTLKILEQYGIVELPKEKGRVVPKVMATDFKVEFGLNYSFPVQAS
jgi:predicted transcriptional regulator